MHNTSIKSSLVQRVEAQRRPLKKLNMPVQVKTSKYKNSSKLAVSFFFFFLKQQRGTTLARRRHRKFRTSPTRLNKMGRIVVVPKDRNCGGWRYTMGCAQSGNKTTIKRVDTPLSWLPRTEESRNFRHRKFLEKAAVA